MAIEDNGMKELILATLAEIEDNMQQMEEKHQKIEKKVSKDYKDAYEHTQAVVKKNAVEKTSPTKASAPPIDKGLFQEELFPSTPNKESAQKKSSQKNSANKAPSVRSASAITDTGEIPTEVEFLHTMRERLLVLFEGIQSPHNKALDKKVDILLSFLEYTLATIEERIKHSGK